MVSHRDLGISNWVDTEGHMMGNLYWRFLLSTGDLAQPQCEVVKYSELAHKLNLLRPPSSSDINSCGANHTAALLLSDIETIGFIGYAVQGFSVFTT